MVHLKSIAAVLVTLGVMGCDSGASSNHWREQFDPEFGVGVLRSIVPFDSLNFPEQAESQCRSSTPAASAFPLSPGNRWTYVFVENYGEGPQYDWEGLLNKDVHSKAGELDTGISVFPVATYFPILNEVSSFELYGRADEGLHAFGGQPENDSLFESSIRYPHPAVLGQSYEVVIRRYYPDSQDRFKGFWQSLGGDAEVVAVDTTISTPAGDFLSTAYRTYAPATRYAPGGYLFEYVSDGVGLVAWEATSDETPDDFGTKWLLVDYCLVPEF